MKTNFLDDIVHAQKGGEARGITSICSAHPWVLKAAMQAAIGNPNTCACSAGAGKTTPAAVSGGEDAASSGVKADTSRVLLIESTCNQVNQFGGYTGMTPAAFAHRPLKMVCLKDG